MKRISKRKNFIKKVKPFLNKGEVTIIKLICKGYSSRQIGIRMKRSHKTIENSIGQLIKKTKSRNRIGIAIYAIRNGIYKLR